MTMHIDYQDRVIELWKSAYYGNFEKLEQLLKTPEIRELVNYQSKIHLKHSALFFACYGHSNAKTIKLLLDAGADPFQRDALDRTPLHYAANALNLEVSTALMDAPGVEDERYHKDKNGQTILHAVFLNGAASRPENKEALITSIYNSIALFMRKDDDKSGLDKLKETRDAAGISAMILSKVFGLSDVLYRFESTNKGQNKKLLTVFLKAAKVPPNNYTTLDFYGNSPFLSQALHGKVDKLSEDVMQTNTYTKFNALQLACLGFSNPETVAKILCAPTIKLVDANGKLLSDEHGSTPLHTAASSGISSINQVLLNIKEIQSNINQQDSNGRTALHAIAMGTAISGEETEKLINLYFSKGIDPDIKDNSGYTALMLAVERNSDTVSALISDNLQTKLKFNM